MKNDYSKVIPQEVLDLVNTKLQECHTALKPYCVEFYGERCGGAAPVSVVEIWVPIERG